jgi:hypothetical protein
VAARIVVVAVDMRWWCCTFEDAVGTGADSVSVTFYGM